MAGKRKKGGSGAFQAFLETIYRREGVDGITRCLPFILGPFAITRKGTLVAMNHAFAELVGYEPGELYGRSALEVTLPEDRDQVRQRIKHNDSGNYPVRLVTRDGKIRHVIVSPHVVKLDGVRYRLTSFVDQTPLLALQAKRVESLKIISQSLAAACEQRDPYTCGHMHRTAMISQELCGLMSIEADLAELIEVGASIHDIGKISVPIEILIKPTRLADHEWAFIKKHPELGLSILGDVEIHDAIKQIVLMHHEHDDGSGYPDGRSGAEIPLFVAIVSVADSLDAIAGERPYRKSHTFPEALQVMEESATLYHRPALDAARELVASNRLSGREFHSSLSLERSH